MLPSWQGSAPNGTRLKVNDVEIDEDDWEMVVGAWEVLAALEIPPEQ